jgi:hypothetical protein
MTFVTIPNRPLGTDTRSIEMLLADFDAITSTINGGLDAGNMSASGLAGFLQSVSGGVQRKIAVGSVPVTFSASVHSAIATIPHGLGVVPVFFGGFLDTHSSGSNAQNTVQSTSPATSTNIFLWAITTAATSGTWNILWVAIG